MYCVIYPSLRGNIEEFDFSIPLFHACLKLNYKKISCEEDYYIESVLRREEGYTVKYSLSSREIPWDQAIFHSISRLESQYKHSHQPNNGSPAAVAYAAVTAVTANIDAPVPLKLVASLEEIIAAMLTRSKRNSHSHSH